MAQKTRASLRPHSFSKAPVYLRIAAAAIDGLIAGLPWFIITPLWGFTLFRLPAQFGLVQGFIVGSALIWTFFYICFRDGYANGQSLGKRCMGLMVIGMWSDQPCTIMQSFLRNVLFWINYFVIVEGIMLLGNLSTGRRIGDFLAQTLVTEVSQFHPRNLK